MSGRTRFCVLFASGEDGNPSKTRLLHSDSSREELEQIWKQIYNEEDIPVDAELINEDCVYRLDDDNDIVAFLAQAEDQYRLLPSQPLRVLFASSHKCRKGSTISPTVTPNNDIVSLPSTKYPTQPEIIKDQNDASVENAKDENDTSKDLSQENCNSGHIEDITLPRTCGDVGDSSSEQAPAWSPANSLLMLYNRCRVHDKSNESHVYSAAGAAVEGVTAASAAGLSDNPLDSMWRCGNDTKERQVYSNQYAAAYTKQVSESLRKPFEEDQNNEKSVKSDFYGVPPKGGMPNPMFNLAAYSAFVNGLQGRNQMTHVNPNASTILQTLFNSHIKGNLSVQTPQRKGFRKIEAHSPTRPQLVPLPGTIPSPPDYCVSSSAFQSERPPSILSKLAHYNNGSLLSYINGPAMSSIQDGLGSSCHSSDLTKKSQKRRKRNGVMLQDDKSDSSKRMRSSISQSNIEYHYQRALDYSQMPEEDQKLQNSAHRSHWKHLLFVAKISPKFLEKFKHAKYDEWSSEARDIYAMCQPDKYMWSFLTLSKQGDMLCKRIIGRITDLLSKRKEDRPDWCPEDEMLVRAKTRAGERLNQLQRILYSRSVGQDVKVAEKVNELDKVSIQGKNLALMTAYQQSQEELHRSQQSFLKGNLSFRNQQQLENFRQQAVVSTEQTTNCSSVTSSPLSVASPAFEDNHSGGSGGSTASSRERRIEGNMIIVEERDAASSPESNRLSYAKNCASPQKWATKTEAVIDT